MPSPNANRERSYDGDMKDEGKAAEDIVWDFLCTHPQVQSVDDLRELKVWQDKDVDFCAHLKDGRDWYVDAKSDTHLAGNNMLYEVLRINHTSFLFPVALGWSARSAANSFLINSPLEARLYSVSKPDLNDAMREFTRSARNLLKWRFIPTDAIKSTIVVLIPKRLVSYAVYECRNGAWVEVERNTRAGKANRP